jgi:uncharacterized protein involved in exopolysaccharide biosynthesis
MENHDNRSFESARTFSPTLRDLLAVGFRHRRLMALSFLGTFIGAVLVAFLLAPQYEARMKILVQHERVDPVVTAEPNAMPVVNSVQSVTEEDMNSEVELITSRDLLEKVVETCGLANRPSLLDFLNPKEKDLRTARAVRRLDNDLDVEPVKKSNIIEVTYATPDAQLSASVLNTLGKEYLAKHLTVRRPPGAFKFFQQQTERYGKELAAAEAHLADFSRDPSHGGVAPQVQRDFVLQSATDLETTLGQTQASIAATKQRIRALESMTAAIPPRLTTTDRKSDNMQLQEQLKSSLLTLELKRVELLDKYDPSYRPVQELEAQIAENRAAIAAEEKKPLREETTDQNPTYVWLNGELAKARADLASFQAQAVATTEIVRAFHERALLLDQRDIVQQDLLRTAKADESSYLLYLNKREEARISDALDDRRIVNVAIAEAATVPALPKYSWWLFVLLGGLLASLVSVGSAFVSDHYDPSFRTPEEVESFLDVPVLAAMPNSGV